MNEIFKNVPKIEYKGAECREALAFKFYDAQRIVLGKPMKEHLRFAISWWHTLGYSGADMFGSATVDKSFGSPDGMEHAFAKADAGFELMEKLGIDYFCFHDIDIIPACESITERNERLDAVTDYIARKMKESGRRLLWATSNLFGDPIYKNGAGTSNSPEVFARAAAQIKKTLEITVKLGGLGYVFWGGREGYDTLWNTDMRRELDNIARLMRLAVDYGRSIGFTGDFFIEPKPKEPMKHQYDYDASTAIGFLRYYGLDRDFKLNIECNHATLAGHTFEHELRVSAINGMLGSIDANQGDPQLGWDTDEFPFDVYTSTCAMYEVLKAGGMKNGGFNFDAKTRRASNTDEDLFAAYILGMDTFALGLLNAAAIIEDGRVDAFVKERYSGYEYGIGKAITDGNITLEELAAYAESSAANPTPSSGRQESVQAIVNQVIFGKK